MTAQLVYEIAAPAYLGPDVVTHLDTVRLSQEGPDRVRVTGTRGTPPPPTLKVGIATVEGYRNAMTFVLTGLDLDAKAALVRTQLEDAVGKEGLTFTLAGTADGALLHAAIHDPDPKRAGRAFSSAAVELALASYPGCTLTTPPGDAVPHTVFKAGETPQSPHWSVHPDGTRAEIPRRLRPPGSRRRPGTWRMDTPPGTPTSSLINCGGGWGHVRVTRGRTRTSGFGCGERGSMRRWSRGSVGSGSWSCCLRCPGIPSSDTNCPTCGRSIS
ncbi:hypothetical protein Psuf_029980 [Phytohabitans suffuscus]|uniref:Acyclic terpene utilisation N-terminal domain-containing protein n=1 Tax=Phytohabitans suffuscus TaxID=624315 RepID=A0A6F8YHT2_9ACTN|nr:hypothetical protein Psuf_029980 [Phytohabitans suffuscus]